MNSRIVFFPGILLLQIFSVIICSPLEKEGLSKEFVNENRVTFEEQQELGIDISDRQYDLLQTCSYYDECVCNFKSERLGCLNRTDIICPEIDSYDVGIECRSHFCFCHDPKPETFHCLFPSDCPTTTNTTTPPTTPAPSPTTSTTTATQSPPPTPPEDDCTDEEWQSLPLDSKERTTPKYI